MPTFTVADVRRLVAGLPDEAPLFFEWGETAPEDHEPGVTLVDVKVAKEGRKKGLCLVLEPFYIDDDDDETEEESDLEDSRSLVASDLFHRAGLEATHCWVWDGDTHSIKTKAGTFYVEFEPGSDAVKEHGIDED